MLADLWALSPVALGRGFATGALSSVEVLEAILLRCEAANPRLNAIVAFDVEGARRAARDSETRWRRGRGRGPLDGVPLTVKDNIPVRACARLGEAGSSPTMSRPRTSCRSGGCGRREP